MEWIDRALVVGITGANPLSQSGSLHYHHTDSHTDRPSNFEFEWPNLWTHPKPTNLPIWIFLFAPLLLHFVLETKKPIEMINLKWNKTKATRYSLEAVHMFYWLVRRAGEKRSGKIRKLDAVSWCYGSLYQLLCLPLRKSYMCEPITRNNKHTCVINSQGASSPFSANYPPMFN